MEAKQCSNGHYYDSKKYASCPFCKDAGGNETMPLGGTMPLSTDKFHSIPPTEPFSEGFGAVSPTEPISQDQYAPAAQEESGVTRPYDEANLGFTPAVGWVVCIRGPHKGQDFRLVTGYNKIGRSPEMAISLPKDDQITRDSHAIIAYEPLKRKFFVAGDKNMIYLNDNFIIGMQELKAYDVLKVGASEIMFVPLCGEAFNWE